MFSLKEVQPNSMSRNQIHDTDVCVQALSTAFETLKYICFYHNLDDVGENETFEGWS